MHDRYENELVDRKEEGGAASCGVASSSSLAFSTVTPPTGSCTTAGFG
jgi:hypothetical protein